MKETARYWLNLSDYDFTAAGVLYKSGIYTYVVFMCHQAIEKALKAYQAETKDIWPLKIHSLWKLVLTSGLYSKLNKEQMAFIGFLEPLNVESRYPTYPRNETVFVPDSENCRKLMSDTEELLGCIKKECNENATQDTGQQQDNITGNGDTPPAAKFETEGK